MTQSELLPATQHGRLAVIGPAETELWRFIEQLALMMPDPPEIAYLSPDHPNLLAWENLLPPPELRAGPHVRLDLYSVPADPFYEATLEFILQRVNRVLFLISGRGTDRAQALAAAEYLQSTAARLGRNELLQPAVLFVDRRGEDSNAPGLKLNELPFQGTPSFFGDLSHGENCFPAFLTAIEGLIPEVQATTSLPPLWSDQPASAPAPRDSSIGSTRMFPDDNPEIAALMDRADDLLAGNEINESLKQSLRVDLERDDEFQALSQRPDTKKKDDEEAAGDTLHQVGEVLYDYTVEKIMHGGLAFVYIAHNARKKPNRIAIKTFRGNIAEALERDTFLAEVQRTIALDPHPNLVKSYWGDVRGGRPYLLMEFVEGGSVRSMLLQNKDGLHPVQALEISLETCNGLAFLWESSQLVHADLKPENILMDRRTGAKVTDLGLAANVSITQGGLGTPPYMSPEQWVGDMVDTRTDIYAFGVFLFEVLTARWPFLLPDEPKREDFEDAHCFNPPVQLAEYFPNLGRELSDIIDRCLQKRPENRYQNFREVIGDLQAIYQGLTGRKHSLLGPGRPGAVEYLARSAIELRADRLDKALENASKSIEAEPRRSEAWVMRGVIFQEMKNSQRAFDDYRRALDLDPYNSRAWFNLGLAHEDAQQWGQAEACFRRVSEIDPLDSSAWLRRAHNAEQLGELQESFACLTNAWEADNSDVETALNLGQLQLRLGRPARAVEWLMELEQQGLKDMRCALLMGQAEMMMGLLPQAENSLQRALLQDPDNPEVWMWRSILQRCSQRHPAADAALNKARERDPGIDDALLQAVNRLAGWWTAEAARLAQGGELVEAADRIAAAVSMAPEREDARLWNVLLFRALGSPHKENTALARMAQMPVDEAALQRLQAELIGHLERIAQEATENRQLGRARTVYTAILNLEPDRQNCDYDLWRVLLGLGEIAAATMNERRLLDRSPELLWKMQAIRDAEALRLVRAGEELVRSGMDGLAREQFVRALLLQGGHQVARYWLDVYDSPGFLPLPLPMLYQTKPAAYQATLQQIASRWREASMMAISAQEWDNARQFIERIMRLGQATLQDQEWRRNAQEMLAGGPDADGASAKAAAVDAAAPVADVMPENEPPPDNNASGGDTSSFIL